MNRYYRVPKEQMPMYASDLETTRVLSNYKHTFLLVYSLLKNLFGLKSFSINLESEIYGENFDESQIIFKIISNKNIYYLELKGNYCTIQFENMKYTWRMWADEVELVQISKEEKDKKITQFFLPHVLILEFAIDNCIWRMTIPMDRDEILDFTFLEKIIKKEAKVEDLKNLYLNCFYKNQTNYEHTLKTEIEYIEKIGESEILLDKLVLVEGKVISYMFGRCKDDVLFSLKDGEIRIKNFTLENNLDVNKELAILLRRSNIKHK